MKDGHDCRSPSVWGENLSRDGSVLSSAFTLKMRDLDWLIINDLKFSAINIVCQDSCLSLDSF
jgi:hypothetical protein